ncbi:MAG TPA: glutathione S-transferase N-terminal domain-containing protein [Baekduia sp.]|uniref:glutathione S-transferase N-terminal domain-containing protein n=1 Tax=Baekduia sp. TaxID=2600305 RepID=UPI002B802BF1|nr:glutathione S-transferase N-terminal domain-containing protein [Baekduia sp.]HMJ32291.1 glutathione S-transferase N-terminal domain-containing protein [Baekduia sp.]
MPARLFVVHGSHPCATAEQALELKGVPFRRVEIPAAMQPLVMKPMFGGRTVPGIRFEDGEKVQGSRAILRALERRVPNPPLYDGAAGAAAIEEAERWGDEVFQPVPRSLLWTAFGVYPRAMHAFQDGQRSPKLPMPVVLAAAKVILPVERRLNDVSDAATRTAIAELPGMLDRIDGLIAAGVLNGERPNAADLQIAPTLRLLWALRDLRPLIAGRPAEAYMSRWLAPMAASVPEGALPMDRADASGAPAAAPEGQAAPTG